jgi:outer membrane murein-binding lipoprotein Lpp
MPSNSNLVKAGAALILAVATWWVGTVQGAAAEVPVLAAKVQTLTARLDRIESKLDLLLEAYYGKGHDRMRAVPGAVPAGEVRAPYKLPPVRD